MVQRMPLVARLVATAVMAVSLIVSAAELAAAQERSADVTGAQQVRAMVLEQREKVLSHIAAILSGERKKSQRVQAEIVEGEVTAEDGEPEGEEPEDGEPEGGEEDGESEGGEAEDEEVEELPDTGVGRPLGADGAPALTAALGALAAAGLRLRRRFVV